jgi:hypothetical protein
LQQAVQRVLDQRDPDVDTLLSQRTQQMFAEDVCSRTIPIEGECTMSLHIDELATRIATLDPVDQEAVWEKVAALNF